MRHTILVMVRKEKKYVAVDVHVFILHRVFVFVMIKNGDDLLTAEARRRFDLL